MELSVDWNWVFAHIPAMWTRFLQHLQLVVIAVVAGFVIALALAIWSYRRPTVYGPITALTGLLYTIPSLAAFALLRLLHHRGPEPVLPDRGVRRRDPLDRLCVRRRRIAGPHRAVRDPVGPRPRGSRLMDVVNWFLDPANISGPTGYLQRLLEHVVLSGAALLTATVIALPAGLYIGHTRRFANAAINVANIGRALPSYALVVMILPISLTLTPEYGLDPIPTFVAMTLLAIPAILISAHAGLRSVDRDLLGAGRGMGLRERQIRTDLQLRIA